jgi:eukaryotic-like serine/threonine-protein kinase
MPSFSDIYRFGEFELRFRARMLLRKGVATPLPSKTFEVLLYLVANPGRVVTKDELLKAIWPDSFVEEGNLTQHVFRLRKALQPQPDEAPYIVTVPGQGYRPLSSPAPKRQRCRPPPGGARGAQRSSTLFASVARL